MFYHISIILVHYIYFYVSHCLDFIWINLSQFCIAFIKFLIQSLTVSLS